MPNLKGRVAVVTGASRGAGRGIALALGECGATVYVTGRSVKGQPTTDNMPGTIDETAESVTSRGGVGVAARCDHTIDADVEALFERVKVGRDERVREFHRIARIRWPGRRRARRRFECDGKVGKDTDCRRSGARVWIHRCGRQADSALQNAGQLPVQIVKPTPPVQPTDPNHG